MTREEILAMKPDRELDLLVIEKVMGLVKDESYWISPRNNVCHLIKGGVFDPSTDISAAWEVLEEMKTKGIHLCIQPHADFFQVIPYKESGDMFDCVVHSLSAPEAICKAALLAVME